MKLVFNKLNVSILLLLIYEVVMVVFTLTGVTVAKLLTTSILWFSVGICVVTFCNSYRKLKYFFPRFAFNILKLIMFWNLINVGRGVLSDSGMITTALGNTYTSLALLVPFVIVFSIKKVNIKRLKDFVILLFIIGILLFIIFFVSTGGELNAMQLKVLKLLFLPVTFLITTIYFEKSNNKIILLVIILLFYVAYESSNRTMMIREIALVFSLIMIFFYKKYQFKWILKSTFIVLLLPLVILQSSINNGESAIKNNLSNISDEEMSTDTRTFLYLEVYQDLVKNNQLLFGKGANGTYYSDYFEESGGSRDNRLTVEVGVLALLLKGGLIATILYLLIVSTAIYYAFFRSNNYYVVGIGFTLFVYALLLFVQNSISYSISNVFIWFFIGVSLSKEIRNMSNLEITTIFKP